MLNVMRTKAYADAYGFEPQPRSGMHAVTVRVRALTRALDLLAKRGVMVANSPQGHWIHPRDTNGFVMHLLEDNGNS